MAIKKFKLHSIKDYRKLKGWTQQRLAIQVGVSQSLISSLENNSLKGDIKLDLLNDICIALEVCLFDILKVECDGTCPECRHKYYSDKDEEYHYYL